MNVLLVCHAGKSVGLGHLSRMLALADALKENSNVDLHLLIQGQSVTKKELNNFSHHVISGSVSLRQPLLQLVSIKKIQFIVFDIYSEQVTEEFILLLAELRLLSVKIVGIDGLSYNQFCDWIHIPTFFVNPAKLKSCRCPVFYGWDSYLLSKPKQVMRWKPDHKILILTGGADVTRLGVTWPIMIDVVLPRDCEIHWVLGPYAQPPILPDNPYLSWIIHEAPDNLSTLMSTVNYAMTTYGVSFFELLHHGVPTVVFSPYGNRDQEELKVMRKENMSVIAKSEVDAIMKLQKLMRDTKKATILSEKCKNKFTMSGAALLAERIYFSGAA